jgi:hypothetical protein
LRSIAKNDRTPDLKGRLHAALVELDQRQRDVLARQNLRSASA